MFGLKLNRNKPQSLDLLERQLAIAITKSEYKRIQLFIGALLIGLIVMSFNFFVLPETTRFFTNEYAKFYVLGWFFAFLAYEVIAFFLARVYLKRKIVVPDILKLTNVTIEAAMPGLLLFVLCYLEHSAIFLDSPLIFFYFILITLSSLNLEIRLSIIIGLVAAGGYLFVTIWSIDSYDPMNEQLNFPPALYYARSLFMMLTALSATFVTQEIKKRHLLSFSIKSERDQIELLFDQQVSKEIVETLMSDNFTSKKHYVSILFLDIRNYSAYVEQNKPSEVIKFQNKFFDPVLRIIRDHHGVTNQIMGDGLMATFGAPVVDDQHVQNAYDASLKIINELDKLNTSGVLPNTKIGIGLHCGNVVMGNIGNKIRKQFSVSGEAVVIAARLEQANKKYESDFLISKEVLNKIDPRNLILNPLGCIKIKNISKKVEAYSVLTTSKSYNLVHP